jgi:hypothetical protein
MAKKQKFEGNTIFNVKPIHITRIKAILDAGYDTVIIHGDGMMFAGKKDQTFDGKTVKDGSDHHKEYNSGVAEINKDEPVSRAKFRAIYKTGDTLPQTPDDVIQEFYDNQNRELQSSTKPETKEGFRNSITVADPVEEKAKVGRPSEQEEN